MGALSRRWLQLVSTGVLISLLWVAPQRALAHPRVHPLDEYLQAIYISLAPAQVALELDLTPGLLVAPQVLTQLDVNGDDHITAEEGERFARALLSDVHASVDDQPVTLTLTSSQFPSVLNLKSGVGRIQLVAVANFAPLGAGEHRLQLQNLHAPVKSAHQFNLLQPATDQVRIVQQVRDETAQRVTVAFTVSVDARGVAPESHAGSLGTAQHLIAQLSAPSLTPGLLALSIVAAVLLGGLHALTPGHGKTLVAAYLVGSRGTMHHALWLGGIVTFTHTISVIAVGLLALLARQFISLAVLVPVLEAASGLLVLILGLRLVLARWRTLRSGNAHTHDRGFGPHSHEHEHTHDAHRHDHDASPVAHRSLLAMGISGGLVPCPEALGIMLVAIGLDRIPFGLGLIVAFSAGLALVLMMIGILLVRSKTLLDRFGGTNPLLQRALPMVGAILVTVLGAGLIYKSVFGA